MWYHEDRSMNRCHINRSLGTTMNLQKGMFPEKVTLGLSLKDQEGVSW